MIAGFMVPFSSRLLAPLENRPIIFWCLPIEVWLTPSQQFRSFPQRLFKKYGFGESRRLYGAIFKK
jgi:hypothetical protein